MSQLENTIENVSGVLWVVTYDSNGFKSYVHPFVEKG